MRGLATLELDVVDHQDSSGGLPQTNGRRIPELVQCSEPGYRVHVAVLVESSQIVIQKNRR